jgi:serine/threonine-protein kinase
VAIKTIRRELIEEDEKAESLAGRFRREAQAAGALNHPGIVSIYEYGEDTQYAYIAMEYVEGNTLREYLARGAQFDERDAVSIMSQLLDALEFAHQRKVWHRDVKPANIIIMSNGRIKLADFGVARIDTAERTLANVIMGTPGYIAPEQYLGKAVDHRCDIFAAGVLLYVLLAGQAPFRGRSEAIMHDVCYTDPEPPSVVDPMHRWPKYDPIVARALAKAPENRFPSAAMFRAAILTEYARPVSDAISEATIITNVLRPISVEPTSAAPRTGVAPGGTTAFAGTLASGGSNTAPPTGWDASLLAGIELELARFLGPVAKVLVRRGARGHADVGSLVSALTKVLERHEDRHAFAAAVTKRLGTVVSAVGGETEITVPTTPATAQGVTPEEVERVAQLLTRYIGPIARVVAKRAAAGGATRRDFFARLIESLDHDQRERFLREAGANR